MSKVRLPDFAIFYCQNSHLTMVSFVTINGKRQFKADILFEILKKTEINFACKSRKCYSRLIFAP